MDDIEAEWNEEYGLNKFEEDIRIRKNRENSEEREVLGNYDETKET